MSLSAREMLSEKITTLPLPISRLLNRQISLAVGTLIALKPHAAFGFSKKAIVCAGTERKKIGMCTRNQQRSWR
jgi:hypothetical protein